MATTRQKERHWARRGLEIPIREKQTRESSSGIRTAAPRIGASDKPKLGVLLAASKQSEQKTPTAPSSPRPVEQRWVSKSAPTPLSGESYGIRCTGWGQDITLGFPQGGGVVLIL